MANSAVCRAECYKKEVIRWTSVQFIHCKTYHYSCDCTWAKCGLQPPPCPFSRDIFNNRFHHFVFIASLWGWVDWQRLRTVKGDQQAWRADELLLLGNSSCWFCIMLIFKNLHEITGSCAETNKAPLSMDQKDQGSQGNLVCNTECFWCLLITCHYNKIYFYILKLLSFIVAPTVSTGNIVMLLSY